MSQLIPTETNNLVVLINQLVILFGVPTIFVVLIYIGRKLQILDDVKKSADATQKEVKGIDRMVNIIKTKMDILWSERVAPSGSPMQLNERGQKILKESGIKEIVDERFDELLNKIKEKNPSNAYQVQENSKKVVYKLKDDRDLIPKLEMSAYEAGVDIDTILLVGAIYLRDLALPKFDWKLEDVDKHDENIKNSEVK